MSKSRTTASYRLKQDYLRLMRDPVPFITAAPLPTNILEWHYVVEGPPDSVYAGGFYHGKLIFPNGYPFKPPSIMMLTPNGRFKTNTRLCLSISDFHPDTWNPAWCVSTILTGLLSFMLESQPTLGSLETSPQTKRQFALQSLEFNIKDKVFQELFPDLVTKLQELIDQRESEIKSVAASQSPVSNSNSNSSSDFRNGRELINDGSWAGALMNLGVLFGFAAFSMIVRYIWKLVANEEL